MKKYAIALLLSFATMGLYAADTTAPSSAPSWYAEVEASIKAKQYDKAVTQLREVNEVNSADWNNVLGYSLRKKSPPDLVGAEKHYQAALRLDPKHRGALEYYGELFLMKNDLPGAESMLARLNKACFFGCEEYTDLKESIKEYKAKKTK